MHPVLRSGDFLVVRDTEDWKPRAGEVAVYLSSSGMLVAHRVRAVRGNRVIFQGDGRPEPDVPVRREQVVGQGVAIVRGGEVHPLPGVPFQMLARARAFLGRVAKLLSSR